MMSGDSIIDSVRSHRLRLCDPVLPTSGSSRDGDSIVPFLQLLFGSSMFISSSRPVPSAALLSVSGAIFMGGFSSFGVGGPPPPVPSTAASGCPNGRLCCHFWGRLGGPSCCCLFVHSFNFRSFFFCCFSSCSFFFCASFGFSSLLSACGSFFFGLLWVWGWGGGGFRERCRFWLPLRCREVVCLAPITLGYLLND